MNKVEAYSDVWDALSDTPGEAANMRVKSELMRKIVSIIQTKMKKMTQKDIAAHCGITQPRINDLLRGRISKFSLDALVNIASSLGQEVHIKLKAA